MKKLYRRAAITCTAMAFCLSALTAASSTAPLVRSGEQRLDQAQSAQQHIDGIHNDTQNLQRQFQQHLDTVDGLKVYNRLLAKQLQNQESEIATLKQSIADVTVIERQITPLLERMITGLEKFVELDLPFLQQERQERIENLKLLLTRADVSSAEKTRRVFEAYQLENDYGRSIESYTAKIQLEASTYDADVLRVGRIALVFKLIGQNKAGYWQQTQQQWSVNANSNFQRHVEHGLKVARKEMAPELITVPLTLNTQGL